MFILTLDIAIIYCLKNSAIIIARNVKNDLKNSAGVRCRLDSLHTIRVGNGDTGPQSRDTIP